MTSSMPLGLPIELDPHVRQLADDVLFGGSPPRILRLSTNGVRGLDELRTGPVRTAVGARLARTLTDAGIAHPRPSPASEPISVTVVIPVHDRLGPLGECLGAVGRSFPVLVVDDGSSDPAGIAAACSQTGATLIRRELNGGPAAARNTALEFVTTEIVAFLDSDCRPSNGWIERLAGHFCDPAVGAVAPRIRPARRVGGSAGVTGRYLAARSPLDLGERPARVQPLGHVSYVPTAAFLVRRAALTAPSFDESMRYGEDVDLVWRLHANDWRLRYDPTVVVAHSEPLTWRQLLRRRYRYGTSAAPLSKRHPDAVAPLVLQPWPTITLAALLTRRPLVAAAAYAVSVGLLHKRLADRALPSGEVSGPVARAVWETALGVGRWSIQFAAPGLLVAAIWPRARAVAGLLFAAPIAAEWMRRRPALDPLRFGAAMVADEVAYGAGVWAGCVRHRTVAPVLPALRGWRRLFSP